MNDSKKFRTLLEAGFGASVGPEILERVVIFREEILKENEVQNLTRLLSPQDFFEGHIEDVIHLERSGFLGFPALDLGAGMGVPGVLHALIYPRDGQDS